MAGEVDFGDPVDPVRSDRSDLSSRIRRVSDDHVLCAQLLCTSLPTGADTSDHGCPGPQRHLQRDRTDPSRWALNQYMQTMHGPVSEHCSIAGDARDPQAGGLLAQNAVLGRVSPVWQSHRERIGHNHVLRGGPERSIGLSPVAPHTLSHPRGIDVRIDSIDRSSAIAVRDDPRMPNLTTERRACCLQESC
jgi:hypothetical protein